MAGFSHQLAERFISLGEHFDEDPFLIFQLRGKDKVQLLAELRQRRSAGDQVVAEDVSPYDAALALPEERAEPLEAVLDRFRELAEGPEFAANHGKLFFYKPLDDDAV